MPSLFNTTIYFVYDVIIEKSCMKPIKFIQLMYGNHVFIKVSTLNKYCFFMCNHLIINKK